MCRASDKSESAPGTHVHPYKQLHTEQAQVDSKSKNKLEEYLTTAQAWF